MLYLQKQLRAWTEEGYHNDWLLSIVLIVINLTIPLGWVQPIERFYTKSDPAISYPYHPNTVSNTDMMLLTFLLPLSVFSTFALLKTSWLDWHHASLTLVEGFAVTTGFKQWMNLVGRLRPNWLASVQEGDMDKIESGRASYPSGHAAYTFLSCTILSLYLCGKLKLFSSGKPSFAKGLLLCSPMALATFVAMTRITDYKHNPSDVNAGGFIGILCGTFCYFLNYPSLFAADSGEPKLRKQDLMPLTPLHPSNLV